MQANNSSSTASNQQQHLPAFPGDHHQHPDDFLDQMLWATLDLPKSPWADPSSPADDPLLLATRFRHHQISSSKPMVLQLNQQHQQLMVPSLASSGEPALIPLPLSLSADSARSAQEPAPPNANTLQTADGLYNGFAAGGGNQQHFAHSQGAGGLSPPSFAAAGAGQGPTASPSPAAAGAGPPRQKVRARRGQATDPHSIAERLRRERIAERMKALQELVPNANKPTDKASMLDEIIDYVKFLQLQVKVLSMSRLGGAAAVAPLVADMSSEGAAGGPRAGNHQPAGGGGSGDSMTVTEHQVAKLMEEDMGSAMQYLQGKGLCLMPISLASAISTATGHARAPPPPPLAAALHHHHINAAKQQLLHGGMGNNLDGSSSPNMSVLTVQSAMAAANGMCEADASRAAMGGKDAASKP